MSSKTDLHDELADLRSFFSPIAYADWDKVQVTSCGKVVTKKGWLGRTVSCCQRYTFDITKTLSHVQSVIHDGLPNGRKIVEHSHECKELYPREDGTAICLQACLLYREVLMAVKALNHHPEVTDKINLQDLGLGEPTQRVVTFPISKVLRVPRKKERDKEFLTSVARDVEALKVRLQEEIGSLGFSLQQLVFFTPELCNELPLWLKNVLGTSLPAIGVMHMINVLERFDKNTGMCSKQITALKDALDTALILSVLILEPSNARKLQIAQELEYHLHDRLKRERLERLQPGERLLLPAGYFNGNVYDLFSFTVNIGHLVMVEFLKQKDGTFDIHCYDASNIMHHETVTTEGEGQKKILPWTIRAVAQDMIADPRFHRALAELAVGGIDGNCTFDCEDLYSRLLFHLLPEHELKKLLFSHDAIAREQLFEDELQQLEVAISRLSVDEISKTMNTLPKQNELRQEDVESIFAGVSLQASWSNVYIASKKLYAATINLNNVLSPCETLESAIKVGGIAHGAVFAIAHIDMVKREPQEGAEVSNYSLDILKCLQTLRQKEDGHPLIRVLRGIKKNGKLEYKSQNTPDQVACQMQGEVASCAFSSILAWLTTTFHDMNPFMSHMLEEHMMRLGQNLSQSIVYYHHPICRFGWSDDLPVFRRLLVGAVGTLSDRLIVPIPISYVQIAHDKARGYLEGVKKWPHASGVSK